MTKTERAYISKELSKAAEAINKAYRMSTGSLQRQILSTAKAVADNITQVNGGVVKLSKAELFDSFKS